ncbi:hypothetical protein ALC62_10740 [Cyphomyrmex costatus]|uniref:GIY-YIG domain-containing protein n=1 Tax=Cyphomyrmex costatus TaxID=456900 RepID=A0A151IDH1_9HYME|nr:hypothetical protein ALC62_10740 [Cyphomyrmex costatus]
MVWYHRVSFFSINKLNDCNKVQKDPVPHDTKMNVIYKIKCNDCDATYIGQTKRKLITRVNEHRNHIRRNTSSKSVITDHRLDYNHEFDWNNVDILDCESFCHKRLISEMLYIKTQSNGLTASSLGCQCRVIAPVHLFSFSLLLERKGRKMN